MERRKRTDAIGLRILGHGGASRIHITEPSNNEDSFHAFVKVKNAAESTLCDFGDVGKFCECTAAKIDFTQ